MQLVGRRDVPTCAAVNMCNVYSTVQTDACTSYFAFAHAHT